MAVTPKARVLVVGGGMAGASLGYELARDHEVVVLEAEDTPARHSTGRSAALWFAGYGPAALRPFTLSSLPLFSELEQRLATPPLLAPRGALLVATDTATAASLGAWASSAGLRAVGKRTCAELCPVLDASQVHAAAYDATAQDIDVMALHAGYLRGLRAAGGRLVCGAAVVAADRRSGGWHVATSDGRTWQADVVVNAAGAWGDRLWATFGVQGHGLVPCRRTVAVARTSVAVSPSWPIVGDAGDAWYFRPEGDGVLLSPGDETPSVPQDERVDPLDVALALERVNAVTTLDLRSVASSWAGQRTFAADHLPVVGPHPEDDALFSFVGQGGYGIQTAPALARAAAAQLRGARPLELGAVSPDRPALRTSATASATA